MLVNSLEKMEQIVDKHSALSWDGWTVLEDRKNLNGATSIDGAYVNGKWIIRKRYEPTQQGWDIPNKFGM